MQPVCVPDLVQRGHNQLDVDSIDSDKQHHTILYLPADLMLQVDVWVWMLSPLTQCLAATPSYLTEVGVVQLFRNGGAASSATSGSIAWIK